jgi:predicted signal transduction protein with EAL and GGDEF domain
VAARIAAQLAADGEQPTLSVSVGVGVHPRDGDTAEALLGAADRLLYEAKVGGAGKANPRRRA